MAGKDFLYKEFLARFGYEPTSCQQNLFHSLAGFLSTDEKDIMVVNGYAGTGKTTAVSAVINTLAAFEVPTVLLAPTGRSAKVLSGYAGRSALTVHKHIYRQKSVGRDGYGQFSLDFNKGKGTVFFVDEVSLIGIDAGQQSISTFGSGNLLEDLVAYVRSGVDCKLVLIGDSAQLPPIGLDCSPTLSRDYMEMFGGTEFVQLTTVVRQQKESGILYNATMLRKMIEKEEAMANGEDWEDEADEADGPDGAAWAAGESGMAVRFRTEGFDDVERVSGADLIDTISDAYSRYGEDETIVLCRSNRRANRYNAGIRAMVQYKEDRLVRGDKLMIVKNCYQFIDKVEGMDFIANGDLATLIKISRFEDRYGLHFATARLSFPDYGEQEIEAKVILDTLESESASLTYEQQNQLYTGVNEDYSHITSKKKRFEAVREDPYFNALQLKYANAITGHKSQGGQWKCVFIDNPLWQPDLTADDLKWLYTAITRAVEKVYFVNFKDTFFE